MNLLNHEFTEPWLLHGWTAPPLPPNAILAGGPLDPDSQYRVIYIEQTGNLAERGFPTSHHKYGSWPAQAGHYLNLYIAWPLAAPNRRLVEEELVDAYRPVCNQADPW